MRIPPLFAPGIWFLFHLSVHAQRLSPLAPSPDWGALDRFQETITKAEFVDLLQNVYAPHEAAAPYISIGDSEAVIKKTLSPESDWILRFAESSAQEKPVPRFWRPASSLEKAGIARPLDGIRIALDPGHLGGEWAHMEERFLQAREGVPVVEGDMALETARLLAVRLDALGAIVKFVRNAPGPVIPLRPEEFRDAAREELHREGIANPRESYSDMKDPGRGETVQNESELLFYRTGEIRGRADLVNHALEPDVTICLHFNAEPWGDPDHPALTAANHLHLILNGCYSAAELRNDDVRCDMLLKLLSRSYHEELGLCKAVANTMARDSGLPPYSYTTPNAVNVGNDPYLWARNLLANRLYRTPVIFIEPYVMNSETVWDRVQAGDYDGERLVGGRLCKSIYREYADAVAEGLVDYYRAARGKHE